MTASTQVRPAAGRTCSKAFPNARRHGGTSVRSAPRRILRSCVGPALRQPSHSLSFAPGRVSPMGWPTHNPLQKMRQRGSPTRAVWPEDRQEDTPFRTLRHSPGFSESDGSKLRSRRMVHVPRIHKPAKKAFRWSRNRCNLPTRTSRIHWTTHVASPHRKPLPFRMASRGQHG